MPVTPINGITHPAESKRLNLFISAERYLFTNNNESIIPLEWVLFCRSSMLSLIKYEPVAACLRNYELKLILLWALI